VATTVELKSHHLNSGARRLACLLAVLSSLFASLAIASQPAESAPRWGFADNWPNRHDGLAGSGVGGIGANTNRLDVYWSVLQPTENGPLNQAYLDQLKNTYNVMLYVGELPIISVGAAPDWAKVPVGGPGQPPACSYPGGCYSAPDPSRPGMYDAWQSFVTQLLQQLPHPAAPPAALEVWNEPNYDRFWWPTPQPAVQAELMRRAVAARNQVYPGGAATTPVVSGGLSPVNGNSAVTAPGTYTQAVYNAIGAGNRRAYFDGLGVHPYPYYGNPQGTPGPQDFANAMWNRIEDVRQVRNANGDAGASLWITEVGVSSQGRSENEQGLALVNMFRSLGSEFGSFVIFSYFDGPDAGAGGPFQHMGVWRNVSGSDPNGRKFSWCVLGRDLGRNACEIGANPQVPGADTQPASNVRCFSARLNSLVNPHGSRTTAYFEYRNRDTGVNYTTPFADVGRAEGWSEFDRVPSLARNTRYQARVIAFSNAGRRESDWVFFSTKNSNCNN
jgi:hypothetical protein